MKQTTTTRIILTSLASATILAAPAGAATYSTKGDMGSTGEPMTSDAQVEERESLGGMATDGLPAIRKGAVEFGFNGYLDWSNDTNYAADLKYGRYVTDNWLLGAQIGFTGVESNVNFSGGLFAEYNFVNDTKWVPFIGVGANWKRIDSDAFESDAIEMVGEFGVKYFLRSNVAVSASMSGTWASDSLPNSNDFGSRVNFGLRYVF